jgi:DNA modification methylase
MAIANEQQIYEMIPLYTIVSTLPVRRVSSAGLKRVQESMERVGFLDNYPLVVTPCENGYQLIDGRHRYEAAKALNLLMVPCVVKTDLTEQERYKLALESNSAAETVVPSTLVTFAEFVWTRLAEKYKQHDIAEMLGWSRSKVGDYALLQNIHPIAWELIVGTFEQSPTESNGTLPTGIVGTPTFNETLLRSILPLTHEQQIGLIRESISGYMSPGSFKERATNYRARNEMKKYARQQLGDLGETYLSQLDNEIDKGAYDKDWRENAEHPKLHKLIASIRDEWERKNSIHLVHGDFYEEVLKIGAGSVDLVLTDPPYNIARDNEFELEGRSNISQDFGEWDKCDPEQFIDTFKLWAREWARILREQGSGYVFTSDGYISHLRAALESSDLHVKATIVWHKTNPGTQVVKTNFKSSVEYILFFTKDQGGHTFNWQGENEMHNFIESPICLGKERLVDAKGNTLHPTQKPEQVLRHLLEISSNRGDTVFDGFAGVGSSGKVAKDKGRKFIGIEQDKAYFEAMQRRLAE